MREKKDIRSCYMGCVCNVTHLLVLLLLVAVIIAFLSRGEWNGYAISRYDGTDGYVEKEWVLMSEGEVLDPHVQLPGFVSLEKDRYYTLSTTLTYDGRQDNVPYAFYYIHHMYTKAYLNGEEVFSYTPGDIQKLDRGRSPGNVYVAIPLPRDCQGMEFTIEFKAPLRMNIDYELPYTIFGDYPTMVHWQFVEDLPHNVVGVVSAFVGVAAILYVTLVLRGREYREGLFMGIFALVFSFYSLTECPFNLFFFANPYYTYFLNYAMFSLMPPALLIFLREKFTEKRPRRILLGMSLGGLIVLLIEWALHFPGILDMREFLPVIHLEYLADMLVLFMLIALMKDHRARKGLTLQMLPILLGVAMDGAIYYFHWDIGSNDATFSSVGVALFLLFELHHVWQSSLDIYMESIRSRYYHEIAFEDNLTGVGNRRAYEAEKEKIIRGEEKHETILVASADVNNLKRVNDTMGHVEGDYLIRSTAQVLSGITEGCGKTFRTGGDEFILLLYDISLAEFEQKLEKAREHVRQCNASGRAHLSIALGYETVEGLDIESAVQRADRSMYVNKGTQKGS